MKVTYSQNLAINAEQLAATETTPKVPTQNEQSTIGADVSELEIKEFVYPIGVGKRDNSFIIPIGILL